jgi:hypothetical protein
MIRRLVECVGLLLSCAVLVTAQASSRTNITHGCVDRFDAGADYFPDKVTVEDATSFRVEYGSLQGRYRNQAWRRTGGTGTSSSSAERRRQTRRDSAGGQVERADHAAQQRPTQAVARRSGAPDVLTGSPAHGSRWRRGSAPGIPAKSGVRRKRRSTRSRLSPAGRRADGGRRVQFFVHHDSCRQVPVVANTSGSSRPRWHAPSEN